MTDRLVQEDGRPARAEHDIHHTGRNIDGVEIDARNPHRLIGQAFPGVRRDPLIEFSAPASPGRAGFAAAIALDRDRDIEADEGADIGFHVAIGAQHRDRAQGAGDRGTDLDDSRILGAAIGVDFLQQGGFDLEGRIGDRIYCVIKLAICPGRWRREDGGRAALYGGGRLGGALDGVQCRVRGMGITEGFTGDTAQAEAAAGVKIGGFHAAIIEDQRFGGRGLEKQFAIIGTGHRLGEHRPDIVSIEFELGDRFVGHDGPRFLFFG